MGEKNDALVSVVIPAWNNWDLTKACLESLAANTSEVSIQVVLADNGSTDATPRDCPALGRRLFGDAFVHVRLPENRGFAVACNQGAQAASGNYLFFLNNDALLTPGWLPPLLDAMRGDPRLAGVGPLLTFPEGDGSRSGRVQHAGIVASAGPEFRHLYELFPPEHPAVATRRRLQVITAAAMLVSSGLFRAHGGFFEGFVNGMEDVDFCRRAAKKGGYFSVIPESRVIHLTNRTAGRFKHERENLRLLLSKRVAFEEDLARLVAEDGYGVAFTPWLELAVVLPEERGRALEAAWEAAPKPARLRGMLAAEPLWDAGYVLWGGIFPEETLTAATLRSKLCPSFVAYRDYADALIAAGQSTLAIQTAAMADRILETLANRNALVQKALALRNRTSDPATLAALEAWLASN